MIYTTLYHSQFGIFLLNDVTGSRVMSMASRHMHYDAEEINTEILRECLIESGKKPVSWATLVNVLHDVGLFTLADECIVSWSQKPVVSRDQHLFFT